MKKIVVGLCVLGFIFMCMSIHANDSSVLLSHETDITNFSNMVIEDDMLRFVSPQSVILEDNYTVVMDKDFIGESNYLIETPKFDVCSDVDKYCQTAKFIKDDAKGLWYQTFEAGDEVIYLMRVPASGEKGTNFVIFHGGYELFSGFEAYKTSSEQEGFFLVDVDNLVDVDLIKNQLTASDNIDGILTDSIGIISDAYSTKETALGDFLVRFGVKDKRLNAGFFNMYVKVVDITAPLISGLDVIELELGVDDFSLNVIKSKFVASDNVDSLTSDNIVIKTDEFTANKNTIGTYPMSLEVSDSSKNKTTKEINIKVKDTIAPVVTGPKVLFAYVTDQSKTVEEIKKLYRSSDLNDGNITDQLVVDLKGYNHLSVGDHEVSITSTDSGSNQTILNVVIKVIDDMSPTFDTSSLVLKRTKVESMTETEIIDFIKAQFSALNMTISDVELLLNEVTYASKNVDSYVYFSYNYMGKVEQSRIFVKAEKVSYDVYVYLGLSLGVIGLAGYFIKKRFF